MFESGSARLEGEAATHRAYCSAWHSREGMRLTSHFLTPAQSCSYTDPGTYSRPFGTASIQTYAGPPPLFDPEHHQDSEIFAPLVVYFGRCQGCKTGEDTGLHPAPVLGTLNGCKKTLFGEDGRLCYVCEIEAGHHLDSVSHKAVDS